jgi:hypothetical protein
MKPSILQRIVVFSRVDLARYSDLLVEAFPDVWFIRAPGNVGRWMAVPPAFAPTQSLPEAHGSERSAECDVMFGTGWQPVWKQGDSGFWHIANRTVPNGTFRVNCTVYPARDGEDAKPENMTDGQFYFRVDADDKAQVSVARKALRLIGKVASNRIQSVRFPSLEVISRNERGGTIWIGRDVARWCREKPDRMAYYQGRQHWGFRPLD